MIFATSDIPPPMTIHYENLALTEGIAERQKDVLSQVLRELFPSASALLEKKSENSSNEVGTSTAVRCLVCPNPAGQGFLVSGSLTQAKTNSPNSFDAQFRVRQEDNTTVTWRISVNPSHRQIAPTTNPSNTSTTRTSFRKDAVFLVKPNDTVRVRYTTDNLSITTTGKALQAGIEGSLVRIELPSQNGNSNRKLIEATVKSTGEVEYVR